MPRQKLVVDELLVVIDRLRDERQAHLDAVSRIDAAFVELGVTTGAGHGRRGRRPGRPRGAVAAARPSQRAGRGARRSYAVSGTQSILNFVQRGGAKGVTTGEIVKHWASEKRRGSAYNELGKLVKGGKVKKAPLGGRLGSQYTLR
jgi:hypothetical protein